MKKLFYAAAVLLVLFELANVYFIMPMPFSQRWRTIDVAYALHSWRGPIRAGLGILFVVCLPSAIRVTGWRRGAAVTAIVIAIGVVYAANFVLAADAMFLQPASVSMVPAEKNVVEPSRLVVGVELNGDARAYPVQFIGYHHQVRDVVGGTPVMVTFCTVCRTGRVYSPILDGRPETFRLVGMDHFNAMFEDATTGSWWRQANGEAIAGSKKGMLLRDFPSEQMTLAHWLALHPRSLVMQPDQTLKEHYRADFDYENGASRSDLTGTNPASWQEKSWVVGITIDGKSRAYDWNRLKQERVVNDELGGRPIVLAIASDNASFAAYERPDSTTRFTVVENRLVTPGANYDFGGRGERGALKPVFASQEFWHSWRTFQPQTDRY